MKTIEGDIQKQEFEKNPERESATSLLWVIPITIAYCACGVVDGLYRLVRGRNRLNTYKDWIDD